MESAVVLAGLRSGDGPLGVRARPSSIKHDCDRRPMSPGGKCLVNVHAKSCLILETTAGILVSNQGPGKSLPGPGAGHPLHGAGCHGVPTVRTRPQTTCPLRARSAGQHWELAVTAGRADTAAHLRTGRLTHCANRPSKQRVAGPVPLTPPCGRPCIGCWQRRETGRY